MNPMPQLQLDEITISNGELCGSVFLDRAFLAYVERKVGELEVEQRNEVLDDFKENIKVRFSEEEDYSVYVGGEIEDNPNNGFENGVLTVPNEDVKAIFDDTVNQVLVLITQQLEESNKARPDAERTAILLVGGFGSNQYLARRVAETFEDRATMVHPPDSWSAIVRGALMRGTVRNRKVRCAYGVKYQKAWTPELDLLGDDFRERHKKWDKFQDKWVCVDCIKWYVKKGEEFSETTTKTFPFFRTVGVGHRMKFEDIIYVYRDGADGDVGPDYMDIQCEGVQGLPTDLLKDIGDLKIRLDNAGMRKRRGQDWYYEVHFELGMTFDPNLKFFFIYEGTKYSEIPIQYLEPERIGGNKF